MTGYRGLVLSVAFLASLLVLVPACKKRPRAKAMPAQAGLTGGKLVFEDDFEKGLSSWSPEGKNWKVVDGRLYTGDTANDNNGVWLNAASLPPNVRVEFTATSVKGNNPAFEGDIKCEFGGETKEHAAGYIIIFGGWKNTLSSIAKKDEHGDGRLAVEATRKVEEGRTYAFAVVRLGNQIMWYLDGDLFLSTRDEEPLAGAAFGFNNWNSRVYFDNVRVFAL